MIFITSLNLLSKKIKEIIPRFLMDLMMIREKEIMKIILLSIFLHSPQVLLLEAVRKIKMIRII